jgi:hypothetical protein
MTEWSARICAAFWIASLFCPRRLAARQDRPKIKNVWTWLWALGAVSLAIHTAVAFGEKHGWSHDAAYAHTAQQTLEKIGIDWGGGLFFNYLTLAWWLIDAIAILTQTTWFEGKRYRLVIEWYIAFMLINATVIFGPSLWFAVAVPVVLLLATRRRLLQAK